jgi:hypothetical protein
MKFRSALAGAAITAVVLTMGLAGRAVSQARGGTPPSWDTLVRCAQMANDSASLACFRAAMSAAGYGPKPEEVAAEKKRLFGLAIPEIKLQRRVAKEEGEQTGAQAAGPSEAPAVEAAASRARAETDEDRVTVELSEVALTQPMNRLLLFTTDGALWAQTDNTRLSRLPKAGQSMEIQRGVIGGYLCKVDKWTKVRCERRR